MMKVAFLLFFLLNGCTSESKETDLTRFIDENATTAIPMSETKHNRSQPSVWDEPKAKVVIKRFPHHLEKEEIDDPSIHLKKCKWKGIQFAKKNGTTPSHSLCDENINDFREPTLFLGNALEKEALRRLHESDHFMAESTLQYVLEVAPSHVVYRWNNLESNHYGFISASPYGKNGIAICRKFKHSLYVHRSVYVTHGKACRTAKGIWEIIQPQRLINYK